MLTLKTRSKPFQLGYRKLALQRAVHMALARTVNWLKYRQLPPAVG